MEEENVHNSSSSESSELYAPVCFSSNAFRGVALEGVGLEGADCVADPGEDCLAECAALGEGPYGRREEAGDG